ncbi:hypothetical protein BC829DRAFT_387061 [Chytridium lagenaria]|nr:hypothetical protein BC829DRAFT_387061 [Chytridium lagenaria]
MYSPLPLHPARMMYFRTLYEGGDTFVMFDPLRGRVSAYKWDQDYRNLDGEPFVVVFEDDVGGSTTSHWEENIVITAVSVKK